MSRGSLFVLSAPSGAGKTSLVHALQSKLSDFRVSISHTTRDRRPGEQHGQAYYFVVHGEFERMIEDGAFLEYARVFDHYYGTARSTIDADLRAGSDVLLEIDWQGAQQVRRLVPDCISIFVLPPSRNSLEERLKSRRQDDQQTIARRMRDAISEMAHYREYDYLVVNDDFEQAVGQLCSIIQAQRLKTGHQMHRLGGLIDALLQN